MFARLDDVPMDELLWRLDGTSLKSLRLVSRGLKACVDDNLEWLKPSLLGPALETLQTPSKFPAVRSLDMSAVTNLGTRHEDGSALLDLLARLTSLRSLASCSPGHTLDFHQLSTLTNLTHFALPNHQDVRFVSDYQWLREFTALSSLTLRCCSFSPPLSVLQNLRQLKALELRQVYISESDWQVLGTVTQLTSLKLRGCRISTETCQKLQFQPRHNEEYCEDCCVGVDGVLENLKGLKQLCLTQSKIPFYAVDLENFSDLTSLHMANDQQGILPSSVYYAVKLKELAIGDWASIKSAASIAALINLTSLHCQFKCEDKHLRDITHLKNLSSLKLDNISSWDDDMIADLVRRLTALKHLSLCKVNATSYSMRTLHLRASTLQSLQLIQVAKLTKAWGSEIANLTRLTELRLEDCPIVPDIISEHLTKCQTLAHLSFRRPFQNVKIDEKMDYSGLPKLTLLESLYLQGHKVQESDMQYFSALPRLTKLWLGGGMHSEEDVSSSEEDVSNLEKKLIRTKIMTKQDWNPRPFPMGHHRCCC